jgi:probable F420-dependent oxidoreductase
MIAAIARTRSGVSAVPSGRQRVRSRHLAATGARRREYFRALGREYTERDEGVVILATIDGRDIAGALGVRRGRPAFVLYSAIDPEFRQLRAGIGVHWDLIRWAREHGCERMDWGGAVTPYPPSEKDAGYGTYDFKRGFGCQIALLAPYFDIVLRPRRYRAVRLVEQRPAAMAALRGRFRESRAPDLPRAGAYHKRPTMSPVTFGISLGSFGAGLVPVPTCIDWAVEAEGLGYDYVWCRDHVLWWSPVLDPFTMLGAIAARTTRVRLGPGVLLVPLRSPAPMAKAVATLDHLSGGRAVLGVGVGGEFPKEFEVCGVPREERGRRTDEALAAMQALWTGAPASFKGDFLAFEDARMEPRPVQRPHPPIWVGGRSEAALARAARFGAAWLAYFVTAEGFARRLARVNAQRPPGMSPAEGGLVMYVALAPTREAGRRAASEYLANEYHQTFDDLVDRYCALGAPEACAATIRQFVDAGVRHFTLIPTCPPDRVMEDVRAMASDVIPLVRRG